MKKISFLLIAVMALFSGCTINEYNELIEFQKSYSIRANQWIEASDSDFGEYFYYQVRENALTNDVFNNGIMTGYLYYVHPQSKVTELHVLPFDNYFVDKHGNQWTEQVSCAFSPGYITFFLKYDDQILTTPSQDYTFQIRFLSSR